MFGSSIYYLLTTRNDIIFNEGLLSRMGLLKTTEQQAKLNVEGRGLRDNDVGLNKK